MDRVEYFGFVVTSEGFEPGPVKVKAISKFAIPRNVHEMRRFVGMATFFWGLVLKFATIVAPLTELTRKSVQFDWTEKEDGTFTQITEFLTSKPVMTTYSHNPNAMKIKLHTDASYEALEAILLQSNERDELHPVFAVSRRNSAVEQTKF